MNLLKQISWGILAFVLVLLFCEAFIWSASIANVSFSDFDPEIGKTYRENVPYLIFNEGMGVGVYNEYGYMGKAYPPERKENTMRLALMGDSYVAGSQVMERHHFRTLLEDGLRQETGREFELLNFGRPGSDLADIYVYKENQVRNFSPDYYLIFVAKFDFYPKNTDVLVPVPKLEGEELVIDMDFPDQAVNKYNQIKLLPQHSTLFNMMNNGLKKTKQVPLGSILLDKVYTWIWGSPDVSEGQELKRVTGLEISEVVKAIIGDMDPEKVIFINRNTKPLGDEIEALLEPFHFIDMSPMLQGMIDEGNSPIDWPITGRVGHWNHKGHEVVAEMLTKELNKKLQ